MGLDTCAGPGARLFAKGRIHPTDLTHLGHEIDCSNAAHRGRLIVRVLLAHHGLLSTTGVKGWAQALDKASAQQLDAFLQKRQVHALLTGHLHTPQFAAAAGSCWELRCGTSLQRHAKAGQSFLVHRIEAQPGSVYLETTAHQRTTAGGFMRSQGGSSRRKVC